MLLLLNFLMLLRHLKEKLKLLIRLLKNIKELNTTEYQSFTSIPGIYSTC